MSHQPLVSVVIPVYNGADYVAAAVESALAQTYSHIEIVVVDDGSAEPVEGVLSRFGDRIKVVRQVNQGVAAARNRGIRESTGELVALLDQDDLWLPHKLERQIGLFETDPDVALVHGDVRFHDQAAKRQFMKARPRLEITGRCYGRLFLGNAIAACTIVMRRTALEAIGFFDERIHGTDDYDVALRMARRFSLGYVDEPLAVYRIHEHNWSKREQEMLKNELQVLEKAVVEDPAIYQLLGDRRVKTRIADLLDAIAYHHFDAGRSDEARRYFWKAARLDPRAYPLLLLGSTLLPSSWLYQLRSWKRATHGQA